MAIIQNIAGVNVGALPSGSGQAQAGGGDFKALFSGICQLVGAAAASTPEGAAIAAIKQGINLLPPGGVKKALLLLSSASAFVKMAKQLIQGRPYRTGQYRLAERYIDQVLCSGGSPDSIKSYRDVPDDYVPEAILFFTVVFGVRITTDEDLWALDEGAAAYIMRPGEDYRGMGDSPDAAIQRAVFLKQTFFPSSTYNVSCWDLEHFAEYPLVAPVPDPYEYGKKYTGPLPGGGQAKDGVILVNADTPLSGVQTGQPGANGDGSGNNNSLLWLGGILLAAGAYLYYNNQKTRKKTVYGL